MPLTSNSVALTPTIWHAVAQVVSDLGLLTLTNTVAWQQNAQPSDPASVLLDTAVVSLKGLGAVVDADGHRGGNIIQEYDEGLHVRFCQARETPPSSRTTTLERARHPRAGLPPSSGLATLEQVHHPRAGSPPSSGQGTLDQHHFGNSCEGSGAR